MRCHLQALRQELDAIAAGADLESLAAGDGGLSAGTFGAANGHAAGGEARPSLPCTAILSLCWRHKRPA